MNSRTGPFIIIGFVRFTRCTVIDSFCRHTVTSNVPGPVTVTGRGSWAAQSTALRSSLPWSTESTLPKRAVDVPGEIHHPALARFAHIALRGYRSWARAETPPPWADPDKKGSASAADSIARGRVCTRDTPLMMRSALPGPPESGAACLCAGRPPGANTSSACARRSRRRGYRMTPQTGPPARNPAAARPTRRRARFHAWPRCRRRAPRYARICSHCAFGSAAILGKISACNLAVCSASSNWSCTISNGMRASISA
jgi:hypothetical protein